MLNYVTASQKKKEILFTIITKIKNNLTEEVMIHIISAVEVFIMLGTVKHAWNSIMPKAEKQRS